MGAGRNWMSGELKRLKELHAAGLSQREMARALNRSYRAIETRVNELVRAGLLPRRTAVQMHFIRQRAMIESYARRNGHEAPVFSP